MTVAVLAEKPSVARDIARVLGDGIDGFLFIFTECLIALESQFRVRIYAIRINRHSQVINTQILAQLVNVSIYKLHRCDYPGKQ